MGARRGWRKAAGPDVSSPLRLLLRLLLPPTAPKCSSSWTADTASKVRTVDFAFMSGHTAVDVAHLIVGRHYRDYDGSAARICHAQH